MDEFEKIRAFSEQMSQKTEQALKEENSEQSENSTEENPDFLREWSQSNPEELNKTDTKKIKKAFWGVMILVTIVVIFLIIVLYLLLRDSMDRQENVPTISPTPVPVKIKPENPGGMVIPDQDKVIYDRVSQDPVPVKVEKLFPDEDPILPPVEENPETTEEEFTIPVIVNEEIPSEEVQVSNQEEKKEEKQIVKNNPIKETKQESKTEPQKEVWHAQLFSSTDKVKVEKTWKTILSKHKGLLSDMSMNIIRAEIAGKGTFYRLQVGDFTSKDRAANLCSKLKKQKQDCVPAK